MFKLNNRFFRFILSLLFLNFNIIVSYLLFEIFINLIKLVFKKTFQIFLKNL
jgi:hypothetical protein